MSADSPPSRRSLVPGPRVLAGVALVVMVGLVLILKISPAFTVSMDDELVLVCDSARVHQGQVPYRDFFNFIPPGCFWFLSAAFSLEGDAFPLTVARHANALLVVASWLLLARVLARAGWRGRGPLALASLFVLVFFISWSVFSHYWLAAFLFFAAFEGAREWPGRPPSAPGWIWIGAMAALSFWIVQTAGLAVLVYWGTAALLSKEARLRSALLLGAGFAALLAPGLVWLLMKGALAPFWKDVFLWTASHYRVAGGINAPGCLSDMPDRFGSFLHLPPDKSLWAWLPYALCGFLSLGTVLAFALGALAAAAWVAVGSAIRRRLPSPADASASALTVWVLALFLRGRPDWVHLCLAPVPLLAAWGVAFAPRADLAAPARRGLRRFVWAALLCGFVFTAWPALFRLPHAWEFLDADRPARESPLNRFLCAQDWLAPGDRVAHFPVGARTYLYLRPAAVGYTRFQPLRDRYHSLEDHSEVAAEIERNRPPLILIDFAEDEAFHDPRSPVSALLDRDYLWYGRVDGTSIYRRRSAA